MTVTVVGLGKLGIPLLAILRDRVSYVIGVDTDPSVLSALKKHQSPIDEPGVQELLDSIPLEDIYKGVERLVLTSELGYAILGSDITFVVVPTPSQEDGQFSSKHVREVAVGIGKALRNTLETQDKRYRLFVLVSTVMPGQTQTDFLEVIEETSGVPYGKTWGVCYSPEFIALGSVIHDILNPDFILIGCSGGQAGDKLEQFYQQLCDNAPPFRRTSLVNAEIAKLALNCYVTTKISYANMLAELCEKVPGAYVDEVTSAIGMDSRIGTKFLTGATPYGGPCFPRDNRALGAYARDLDVETDLIDATDSANTWHIARIIDKVSDEFEGGSLTVLGTSYKIGTADRTQSLGQYIINRFLASGAPYQYANRREEAQQAIDKSSIVVITLPFMWAKDLDYRGKTVIDCWRILDNPVCKKYIPIGVGAKLES